MSLEDLVSVNQIRGRFRNQIQDCLTPETMLETNSASLKVLSALTRKPINCSESDGKSKVKNLNTNSKIEKFIAYCIG